MGEEELLGDLQSDRSILRCGSERPCLPSVLGYLKIPGYWSYLHPFDENHIIDVGKEDSNVKLSLFDVSRFKAPKEIVKFSIDFQYFDSEAHAIRRLSSLTPKSICFPSPSLGPKVNRCLGTSGGMCLPNFGRRVHSYGDSTVSERPGLC